jgi:hypothetical protein
MKTLYALLLLTAIADSAIAATPATDAAKPAAAAVTAPHAAAKPAEQEKIKVSKATGPNAYTVAEINNKRSELKDKPVMVHGKVVKYTGEVMKKNWVHLRDGTGSEADNDVLVTTSEQAKIGDVVTVKGVVRVDKDFGAGYSYKVLIEDAVFQK